MRQTDCSDRISYVEVNRLIDWQSFSFSLPKRPREAMSATATPSTQKVQPEMRARSESLQEQHDDDVALSPAVGGMVLQAIHGIDLWKENFCIFISYLGGSG